MDIHNAGFGYCHPTDFQISRPKGSGDYLLLILKSRAYFTFDGIEKAVNENTVILFEKGIPQIYRAADEQFRNDWIHFEPTAEELDYIAGMDVPFNTPIPLSDTTSLSEIIKSIYREKFSVACHRAESMELYFRLLILKINECMLENLLAAPMPHYDRLSRLRAEIYNEPERGRSVKSIAEELALSCSYLQHLYKRIFGVSVTSDIIAARVDRAKYLLSGTAYTVNVIAEMCGYNNDVHFMRQFKSAVGITPTEYRKRFRLSHEEINIAMMNHPPING